MGVDKQEHDAVEWLNLYGDALYRFAMFRVQDSFAAEDMVQETLLAACGSYKNFSGTSSVKTWLTGILKHKIGSFEIQVGKANSFILEKSSLPVKR